MKTWKSFAAAFALLCGASALAQTGTIGSFPAVSHMPAGPSFPLKVSENRRYLVDQAGKPFFVMGDTPWFIQKLKIEDVRMLMDDRVAKGFNTLFLELLDDERIPSIDGYGHTAFNPETDITGPVEAYWKHADAVLEEAERRGPVRHPQLDLVRLRERPLDAPRHAGELPRVWRVHREEVRPVQERHVDARGRSHP